MCLDLCPQGLVGRISSMRIMLQGMIINMRGLMSSHKHGQVVRLVGNHSFALHTGVEQDKKKSIMVCRQCLGAALTDKQAGKRVEKYKDLAVKLLSAPLKNDNVEKMNRLQAERVQP